MDSFCTKAEEHLSKFEILREHGTSAPSYEMDTDDIIATLSKWDTECGITVSEVGADRFMIQLQILPTDLDGFANELYAFCPNIVEQDFGCYPDILESADALPPEYVAHVRALSDGIDFDDEDFAFQLLKKSLIQSKTVSFMWD
jgi:Domain of unknown function (DUF4253)